MTALATDNFNRANGSGLGANWTVPALGAVAFNISSNTAVPSDLSGSDDFEVYTGVAFPGNHYSKAALTVNGTGGSGQGNGLVVRQITTDGTGYRFVVDHAASSNGRLEKKVGYTGTTLQTITQAWSDGDIWELDANGSTISVLLNGVSKISVTDAANAGGGPGLSFSTADTSASTDNWEGGDFTTVFVIPHMTAGMQADVGTSI